MTTFAAVLFVILAGIVIAFQIALLCGAPWGELTLGGRFPGKLPGRIRMIPLISALLLTAFAVIVAARAGLVFPALYNASTYLVWMVVAYCALGSVVNAITPSRRERNLWLPVLLVMLIASVIVALS